MVLKNITPVALRYRHVDIYEELRVNLKNCRYSDFIILTPIPKYHARKTFYDTFEGPKSMPFLQCFTCEHASNFRSRYP